MRQVRSGRFRPRAGNGPSAVLPCRVPNQSSMSNQNETTVARTLRANEMQGTKDEIAPALPKQVMRFPTTALTTPEQISHPKNNRTVVTGEMIRISFMRA